MMNGCLNKIIGADPFGYPTLYRPWDDGSDTLENAKRRMRAAFEFFKKLGVKHSSNEQCTFKSIIIVIEES